MGHREGWLQHSAHLWSSQDLRTFFTSVTHVFTGFRQGSIECLTRDHRIQVRSETHCLSRAMGIESDLHIDYRTVPVEPNDLFLLTTDGIHDYLTETAMKEIVLQHDNDLTQICQAMVAEALVLGSRDNVTSLIAKVEQLPAQDKHAFYQRLTALPFPPPLAAGMKLDGYRIVREIHASKRSELYLALDEETDTQVLLKIPSVNYEDDPTYIDLFLHESWIGKRLDSPHVVKILDHARHKTFLYIVLEHIEGQTLRQWMSDHPTPSLRDVRNIVEQVAVGLRAFHRKEMIHQDMKPENIMIDAFGSVKIIDFGSTKVAGVEEIVTPIERPYMLGTAAYAAPEYLQGYAGSNRSDIFSLGVLTYEMLTGHLPYGVDPMAGDMNTLTYTPGYQYNAAIPVWMDGALAKAVHPNPADRYAALSEFLYDLSHPNAAFLHEKPLALIERNPAGFWRWMALVSLLANVILLYVLSQ